MSRCWRKWGNLVDAGSQTSPAKYDTEVFIGDFDDEKKPSIQHPAIPQRKLTKPRTNTTTMTSSPGCLPAFSLASARLHTILTSKPKAHDEHKQHAMDDGSMCRDTGHILFPGRKDSTGSSGKSSLASIITAPLRKRTILRAPLTTSKSENSRKKPLSMVFDPGDPEFAPLDALDLAVSFDRNGCHTPSGYSVLGGFKRGSLRITNGSPAPSSSHGDSSIGTKITRPPSPMIPRGHCRKCNIARPECSNSMNHDSLAPTPYPGLLPPLQLESEHIMDMGCFYNEDHDFEDEYSIYGITREFVSVRWPYATEGRARTDLLSDLDSVGHLRTERKTTARSRWSASLSTVRGVIGSQ